MEGNSSGGVYGRGEVAHDGSGGGGRWWFWR